MSCRGSAPVTKARLVKREGLCYTVSIHRSVYKGGFCVNILAIGNSFSRDATAYLAQILRAGGVEARVVNLCIGGCPLERHWRNIETGRADYEYQVNGQIVERRVSIQQALEECEWDFIITQQASHDSGWADTYEPFLTLMTEYLRAQAPKAVLCLHQTWAYEQDSDHVNFMRYSRNQALMYRKLTDCCQAEAHRHALKLIPCGTVIQTLREKAPFRVQEGGMSLCRDGYHMHLIYGRYALACTWARALCGMDVSHNAYIPVSECDPPLTADAALLELIRQTVMEVCAESNA